MHPSAASWFARRTSTWRNWPITRLVKVKADTRVSVVLPALNEEATVGAIVRVIRGLADRGLVDEIIVVDSGSTDRTADVAAGAGATVHHRDEILPALGSYPGKGEVLWKSLAVTTGDIIVFVDADLIDFQAHFVTGLLGPLLTDPTVAMVKAFYDRPLVGAHRPRGSAPTPEGGGRVTELMARPLLGAYFPELAGVVQPLAGEYAARRSVLTALPFEPGYGVETGLLIDATRAYGLDSIAQVDLGQRTHSHQDTAALGRMAATILHTVLDRVDPERPRWPTLTQFQRDRGRIRAVQREVTAPQRPPMDTIPGYAGTPA